jgi:TDG/mug DNA glycosylase family protein
MDFPAVKCGRLRRAAGGQETYNMSDDETSKGSPVRKKSGIGEDVKPKPPTRAELEAARGKTLKDVIRPRLDVLFVGINPGLYTAAIGHHFGRPGNRFWPALNASGLLRAPLTPYESTRLLESNVGITNIVDRATAAAAELTRAELRRGARRVTKRILRY